MKPALKILLGLSSGGAVSVGGCGVYSFATGDPLFFYSKSEVEGVEEFYEKIKGLNLSCSVQIRIADKNQPITSLNNSGKLNKLFDYLYKNKSNLCGSEKAIVLEERSGKWGKYFERKTYPLVKQKPLTEKDKEVQRLYWWWF